MSNSDAKAEPKMAKTTITVPEKIILALRNYMALNNIPLCDQGRVVEEALRELFKNNGIPIDSDATKFEFSLKEDKIKKMNVTISTNILKALRVYMAVKDLNQHAQSRVVIVAMREFLDKRKIPIDDTNARFLIFEVDSDSFIPLDS